MWLLMASILVFVSYQIFEGKPSDVYQLKASEFFKLAKEGKIKSVVKGKDWISGKFTEPQNFPVRTRTGMTTTKRFTEFRTPRDIYSNYDLDQMLEEHKIEFDNESPSKIPQWVGFFASGILPLLLLVGVMFIISRQMQGTGNRALSFGKSRARLHSDSQQKITFADVAGCDEAKSELQEVVEFLKDPKKFQKLGGRIPKGVLLTGPPGTGKTMLARAVAGEAGVPFFSISGSDFVEMFVGVGASRVRDLFENGKKNAPCIIFIDELDAVGRHRGAGIGGGHDEREQTLNQLLVEMDGFNTSEGVILITATNRPDVLDPALLRPGRIDRQVVVDFPDVRGREGIFKVHTKRIPLAPDVDLKVLAQGTPGFSGADIANMVNESALLAAKKGKDAVDMACLEEAKDKGLMGPERRSLIISDKEKRIVAYHEAGHALLAHLLPDGDPNYKCSIVPRGRALGVTQKLPLEERHNYGKKYLLAEITTRLGGRVAEELEFGDPTTGAKNDFEVATDIARRMVCEWGMNDTLGTLTYGRREEQIFLGKELVQHKDYSESTAIAIDREVRNIVDNCYQQAQKLLKEHWPELKKIVEALLEKEVLDAKDIEELVGRPAAATTTSSVNNILGE
jgi:cell division protease FtsH